MTERILVFFVVIAIGYAVRRWGRFKAESVLDLIKLNQDICMPALVFTAAATHLTPEVAALDRGIAGPLLGLPLAAVAVCLGGLLIAWLTAPLAGLTGRRKRTYWFIVAFANATFLPVPLSYALNHEYGVLFVSLYTLGYFPLTWGLGIWMLSGTFRWRFALHPAVFAVAAGSILGLAGVHLPALALDVLEPLGATTIPVALLCVGALLADSPLALASDARPLAVLTGVKLVLIPGLALWAVKTFGVPEPIATQGVLQAAMPCMAQAGLYAARFGGDGGFGSKASFVTTLVCLATVPVILRMAGA